MTIAFYLAIAYGGSIVYTAIAKRVWQYLVRRKLDSGVRSSPDCHHRQFSPTCPYCRRHNGFELFFVSAIAWPVWALSLSVLITARTLWRTLTTPHRIILTAPESRQIEPPKPEAKPATHPVETVPHYYNGREDRLIPLSRPQVGHSSEAGFGRLEAAPR
jgi:hypothetical protein